MTQNERVLQMLRDAGARGITPREALFQAGSFRLAARVYDLRREGHDIEAKMIRVGDAHVACYVLHEPARAAVAHPIKGTHDFTQLTLEGAVKGE